MPYYTTPDPNMPGWFFRLRLEGDLTERQAREKACRILVRPGSGGQRYIPEDLRLERVEFDGEPCWRIFTK